MGRAVSLKLFWIINNICLFSCHIAHLQHQSDFIRKYVLLLFFLSNKAWTLCCDIHMPNSILAQRSHQHVFHITLSCCRSKIQVQISPSSAVFKQEWLHGKWVIKTEKHRHTSLLHQYSRITPHFSLNIS